MPRRESWSSPPGVDWQVSATGPMPQRRQSDDWTLGHSGLDPCLNFPTGDGVRFPKAGAKSREVSISESGPEPERADFHLPIIPASSTGRCNTIKSVDPTILPLENRFVRLSSIRPKRGGVAFESMLANDFGF